MKTFPRNARPTVVVWSTGVRVEWSRVFNGKRFDFIMDTFDTGGRQLEVWGGEGRGYRQLHKFTKGVK